MKQKIFFITSLLLLINTYSHADQVDLTESDMFVRQGFNEDWINSIPKENDNSWQKFPAKKGDRPVRVRQLNFDGIPKFKHFSFQKSPIMTFTYVTHFNLTYEKIKSEPLGLFLAQIGQNWEIYINGHLLKSEIHLSNDNTKIIIERSVRNELIYLNHNYLKHGRNILAFKIIGSPLEDRTGLFMGRPYLIDQYEKLNPINKYILSLMMLSIYIFFGIYHIFLFITRPKEKFNLAYSLFALISAAYILFRLEIIFTVFRDTHLIRNIELIALFLVMPSLSVFIDLLLKNRLSKISIVWSTFGITTSILSLFFWKESILRITQLSIVVGFLYIIIYNITQLVEVVKKRINNDKNKNTITKTLLKTIKAFLSSAPGNLLLGFIILIITSYIDISSLNMGKPSRTVEYGYFVFLVGISIILANQFVKIHNKYEELNISLEKKVNERTQELEIANQKLVERSQNIEEELKTARLLQKKLLPEIIPEISGFRCHTVYIPMDQVGGDFYDLKATYDNLEVFIADGSGHGLPGAFLSMITKMAFEGINPRESTFKVLYIINDILVRSTLQNNFVSMFYCMLDRSSNILKYCNAGHFPPIVYRKSNNEIIELNTKGYLLGWLENIKLEEKEIQLKKGDRIIFYTDGAIECKNNLNEEFGIEKLIDFIKTNIDLDPKKFSDELLKQLRNFSGEDKFDDDLCLIVLDVL